MAAEPGQQSDQMMSAINVTPFVDVVLVLLVIFMVTAPLIAKDVLNIQLPKTETGDGKKVSNLGISVNKQGQVLLNGTLITEEVLKGEVQKAISENRDAQAIIAADVETQYGSVARVIDVIKTAGLNKFAIQVNRQLNHE